MLAESEFSTTTATIGIGLTLVLGRDFVHVAHVQTEARVQLLQIAAYFGPAMNA